MEMRFTPHPRLIQMKSFPPLPSLKMTQFFLPPLVALPEDRRNDEFVVQMKSKNVSSGVPDVVRLDIHVGHVVRESTPKPRQLNCFQLLLAFYTSYEAF